MAWVRGWIHPGILSMGKANPESMKAGIAKKNVEICACCWVDEMVEMKRPMATELRRKRTAPQRRTKGFPLRGTSNQKHADESNHDDVQEADQGKR